jgi:RHS repeat-associated protein
MRGRGLWRLALVVALGLGLPMSAGAQDVVEYYGTDAIGSVRIVFDASGNIVGRMDYGPFGEQLSPSIMGQKSFAGLFRDGEAGLDYAQARSFQVRTGRFSAPDPVYAGLFDPQTWNRYSYALNNPLTFIDPSGLMADDCKWTDKWVPGEKDGEGFLSSELKCPAGQGGGGSGGGGWADFLAWMNSSWTDSFSPRSSGNGDNGESGGGGESTGGWLDAIEAGLDAVSTGLDAVVSPGVDAIALQHPAVKLATEAIKHSRNVAPKVAQASKQFINKAGKPNEWHHIIPQYLGGAKDGLQVLLNPAYHQAITNAFRAMHPYGQAAPSGHRLAQIVHSVYTRYPLPRGSPVRP